MPPLPREFFDRDPVRVAREAIGKLLISESAEGICAGRIVETEAYLARGDSACHAATRRSGRNEAMFGPPGHAYVYAIHSRWCFNLVTEPPEVGSAVLVRALEPLVGLAQMQRRRGITRTFDLARGPARLCEAIGIGRNHNHLDLVQGAGIWLASDGEAAPSRGQIGRSVRIGVTSAQNLPLRFFVRDCRYVSGPRRLNS
ncbi:MAG: DNA-3-methyladenine glycosylase [Planctomycetes bacterium]|nr:DNA-3-methyladenine glycosylase [Planctomycetota bacterium]